MVTAEQHHKLVLASRTIVAALATYLLFPQTCAFLAPLILQIWTEIHLSGGFPKPSDQE